MTKAISEGLLAAHFDLWPSGHELAMWPLHVFKGNFMTVDPSMRQDSVRGTVSQVVEDLKLEGGGVYKPHDLP